MTRDPFKVVELSYPTRVGAHVYRQRYLGVISVPGLYVVADHEVWSKSMTVEACVVYLSALADSWFQYAPWTFKADPIFQCQMANPSGD